MTRTTKRSYGHLGNGFLGRMARPGRKMGACYLGYIGTERRLPPTRSHTAQKFRGWR